ncbi:MAG: tRNA dimethylallyltransferase [Methylophagaceae bacterium]|jgi:tRNA dimethylallyltransferase
MGPTAAGKTDLALQLVSSYPAEIISVDSALVYRGMDIGTAKPSPSLLAKYPHHLVNIIEPTQHYSVGDFRRDALILMADITNRGRIPVLVGGTMLYFKALQQGLADLPVADKAIRARLNQQIAQGGLKSLHNRLMQVDPVSAKRIHQNDPQRLQRALEVYEITGKSLTELTQSSQSEIPYRLTKVIVSPFDRSVLHARIAKRYQVMMANGFLEEVNALYQDKDCHTALPAIRAVGYRQLWRHLSDEYDLDEAIEKAIIATRQMAKRQLTWLRAQEDGTWFDTGKGLPMDQIISFLSDKIPELVN